MIQKYGKLFFYGMVVVNGVNASWTVVADANTPTKCSIDDFRYHRNSERDFLTSSNRNSLNDCVSEMQHNKMVAYHEATLYDDNDNVPSSFRSQEAFKAHNDDIEILRAARNRYNRFNQSDKNPKQLCDSLQGSFRLRVLTAYGIAHK